jgi:phage terminase large subunit
MKYYAQEIPGHQVNESELRVDYPNGGQVRIYGSDNPDRLRGLYFDGVVLDEYGLMPPRIFTEVVSPTLVDRQGWAFFIGTPNGKNQFYDVAQRAKESSDWFFAEHRASQTGIIPPEHLAKERGLMTPDEYAQEYECSFEASVKGAIYARELLAAREQGRLARVPYDPAVVVDTDWDLGFGDLTAVWFSQSFPTGEVRLVDYYEAAGHGLPHFVSLLKAKGYTYGEHWAPHDIQLLEMSGHSRWEAAQSLGLHFMISPKVAHVEDGIHAARMLLPRCYFDADKCRDGLEALANYRWKVPNVQDPTGRPLPIHDWASHGADAFRGLAYRHYVKRKHPERDAAREVRRAQKDHDPYDARMRRNTRPRGGY